MRPIASTLDTRRREVIERATRIHGDPRMTNATREAAAAVVMLGPDATADAVNANPYTFWRVSLTETCGGCGAEVERLVIVGEEQDVESITARLCRPCLVAALAALDGAP